MKLFIRIAVAVGVVVAGAWFLGPKFPRPHLTTSLPTLNVCLNDADNYLKESESAFKLKPDNQSRIIWNNDSVKAKTPYCLLYLHGFSASWYEGYPTHQNFARHFGMNLYIPRLAAHGIDTETPLIDMTPEALYESAKKALVLAHVLGEKVIVMGTSTGGTLALKLAADFPQLVDGLVLLSPNIAINNPAAFLLSGPWGLQIARKVYHSDYRVTNDDSSCKECLYWNCKYRLEATVYLQQLVEITMTNKTFRSVKEPLFLGYYYKDDKNQDGTVKVSAMLKMFDQLGTPDAEKKKLAFPDAGTHVIGCEMFSKSQEAVQQACIDFGEQVLHLKKQVY